MEQIHNFIIKLNNKIIASTSDKDIAWEAYENKSDYYENLQKENKLSGECELVLFDLNKNCELAKANFY